MADRTIRIDVSGERGAGSTTLAAFIGRKLLEAGMEVEYLGHDTQHNRIIQDLIDNQDEELDLSDGKCVVIYDKGSPQVVPVQKAGMVAIPSQYKVVE